MFLLRAKLMAEGEKREGSTKTCNETMLRDKLRVFVPRISSPLERVSRDLSRNNGQIANQKRALTMDALRYLLTAKL